MKKLNDELPVFRIADLFCGAGGTSAGAIEAVEALGFRVELTAINHWQIAIDTHELNHPGSRALCTGIESVNPLHYFKRGELDLLWASPECTHHSIARGGKPINDQSRSTAWHVIHWAEQLAPPIVLIENVVEMETWGEICDEGRPVKSKKGKIFRAFLQCLRAAGYKVSVERRCCADYGDPTTRVRLFIMAVRGESRITGRKNKTVWPMPTHAKEPDMMIARPWTPARDIIDWSLEGKSIFTRKRPLSDKTLARIWAGLRKFGLKDFVVPNFGERPGQEPRTHDVDAPLPAVTSHGAGALVSAELAPFIVPQQTNPTPKSVEEPLPTLVADGSGLKLCQPFIIPQHSSQGPRSVDLPAPTVTTTSRGLGMAEAFLITTSHGNSGKVNAANWNAHSLQTPLGSVTSASERALIEPFIIAWDQTSGGPGGGLGDINAPLSTIVTKARHGIAQPFIVTVANGGEDEYRSRSIDSPAPTVTACAGRLAMAMPILINLRGGTPAHIQSCSSDIEAPAPTITANGNHLAIATPFLVNMKGQSDAADIDRPSPTITAHAPHLYLGEPFLVQVAHGVGTNEESRSQSLNSPLRTVCGNRGSMALVESFLVKTANGESRAGEETRARDLDVPLPTVTGSNDMALIEPCLLGQQTGSVMRPISEPVMTVSTSGAVAFVEPFLITYYGNGGAQSVEDPLDTVTTKDRHGLVFPVVELDGKKYLLDIKFRMLQPHELALAQGFRPEYQFTGNKSEIVKQVGNAVPRRTVRAIVFAAVSQNADVTSLIEADEKEAEMGVAA